MRPVVKTFQTIYVYFSIHTWLSHFITQAAVTIVQYTETKIVVLLKQVVI